MKARAAACLFCLALVMGILCSPVSCHTAQQMGLPPDQYDQGIPVYWPFHAGLMSAGFILLMSGFIVMRYHKTAHWYSSHLILQSSGGVLALAGLGTSFSMVALSGAPHFRYLHDSMGLAIILALIGVIILGYGITTRYRENTGLRQVHRWLGRLAIAILAVNIMLGASMMAMVLAQ